MKDNISVDIIIPVYNAYDDLKICLESLYKYTNLQKHRLVIVNDNSSDPRIAPYLDEQKKENIIVIHNEKNEGFSHNINLGMKCSEEHDVILLNSDTVLTKNWVEKMLRCAYSHPSIGTVTPLSNNATLCSVPNFCEENQLPSNISVDKAAEIVESCSLQKYPRITVAHGFCMLVKREVINQVGYFDEATFGRGYGEENDFCNRAEQMGYIHVMCDDTYILHTGTKSFMSKEKEEYIKEHDKILQERYPEQMQRNMVHCMTNPNKWVGEHIELGFDIYNGKKNIFFLLQADFREGCEDNLGGTQLHVKHLCEALKRDNNVIVAARDLDYLQVTLYTQSKRHTFRYYIGEKSKLPIMHDRNLAELFYRLLVFFHVDVVHVHHTATTSLDIFFEAQKLGIPVYYTVHDFYSICPNEKLLDINGCYCIENEKKDCQECLQKKKQIYTGAIFLSKWQNEFKQIFQICERIITPSLSAKEILCNSYANVRDKVLVIEHGMDMCNAELLNNEYIHLDNSNEMTWKIEKVERTSPCIKITGNAYIDDKTEKRYKIMLQGKDSEGKILYLPTNFERNLDEYSLEKKFFCYLPNDQFSNGDLEIKPYIEIDGVYYSNEEKPYVINNVQFENNKKFKVAFIGGINKEKGGEVVTEVIKSGKKNVEWYVFGGIGDEKLLYLKNKNLVKTGFYFQEDIGRFLKYHNINVVCILSIWPETFSYTLSEAVINQIPVITSSFGALGQRVAQNNFGKTVAVIGENTGYEVNNILESWLNNAQEYERIKDSLIHYQHKTIAEMAKEYNELYPKKNNQYIFCNSIAEKEIIYKGYRTTRLNEDGHEEQIEKIRLLQEQLRIINNSVTYKMVRKLTGIHIPGKEKIRNWLTNRGKE